MALKNTENKNMSSVHRGKLRNLEQKNNYQYFTTENFNTI